MKLVPRSFAEHSQQIRLFWSGYVMFEMFTFGIFILICVFTVQGTTPEDFTFRIIDGRLADIKEFPYQVSIMYNGTHHCGGSILSRHYILTAAHCAFQILPEEFTVRVGSSTIDKGGQVHNVKKIHIHPNFTSKFEYDVAIIRLATPLVYSLKVMPVVLAYKNQRLPPAGTLALVAGWGRTNSTQDKMSSHLMFIEVPLMSHKLCKELYAAEEYIIDQNMFCAGHIEGGIDSCMGDSGGPMIINGIQFGIVSWGIGCALKSRPGVYASVPGLRNYIFEKSGI